MNFLVAYRFLFSKYNLSFISIISKVSIIGLTLGVGILITVLSVMNGFEKELRDKILGFTSHIQIHSDSQLSSEELISIIDNNKDIASYSFVTKNEELISRFYTKFTVDVLTNKLMSFASGSARDFFRREIFKEHQLVLPSKKILKFYSEITNLILKRIALNHKKMILLSSLKKILISKFISGKLKITDAEKIISEVST